MKRRLEPHPASDAPDIHLAFRQLWLTSGVIRVLFVMSGNDFESIHIPKLSLEPTRKDELWRSTCFELFLRDPEGTEYFEYNMSPSCHSASYRFDDYRDGMQPMLGMTPPIIHPVLCAEGRIDERDGYGCWCYIPIPPQIRNKPLLASVSAVIETNHGGLSYWALNHPPGKPDFHHPDCFALSLPAPAGA